MNVANEEVAEVVVEIPQGHQHLRATIVLQNGREFTFQEATIANIVRAYIAVKTHPEITKVHLRGGKVPPKKEGFADWQLLETR
jgi:hypothetical protein